MISPCIVLWLLLVHWIADFVFQTDEMAIGKSTSNRWLSIHVLIYTWTLLAFGVSTLGSLGVMAGLIQPLSFTAGLVFTLLNGALHWVTDYFTSRWTSSLWKQGRRHDFFVAIGADQLIHVSILITTAYYLLQ